MIEDDQAPEQAEPGITEIEDIETLKKVLAEERAKAEDYLANWKRAQADFVNYKRRSELDREANSRFANSVLILNLLPVLDDLQRALHSVPPRLAKLSWVDGVRLIERKFGAALEAQGLTPIKARGEPFDPNLHQAMMRSRGREGMVVRELQRGYKLHDRVLRPAMVAVGGGEQLADTERQDEDAED
jgi:molecular chaperone GrpE